VRRRVLYLSISPLYFMVLIHLKSNISNHSQFIYVIQGGHAFTRANHGPRRTVVPTVSFDEAKTKRILKTCKERGVSISNAVFALCNLAWARMMIEDAEGKEIGYGAGGELPM